ncbi:hypothetical protein EI94DRAFT_1787398 [Lactarius quietus]|nr:hypothetical protein EI94DRAFT_1787398 [Lactarius quietus]
MSFVSVEPQSRVLLNSHSNSLLAQFNPQIRIITDRYLAFFEERRSIEATYVDSLRRLYRKAKTVDASFDPRAEPSTTRAAWDKLRDNLEREANIQQAFVNNLDDNVINPLKTLKVTNDETRKRIEEGLKKSAARYGGYAENTIAKLQHAYSKKYYPGFGGKDSTPFRFGEPAKCEPVFDDFCRLAVGRLNDFRSERAEDLGDGYDSLQELVFSTTVKDILVKYMDGMTTACVKYDDLAMSTRAKVEEALAGRESSDLRASFCRTLSISIPPQALYSNYRLGYFSQLVFGVPLVDLRAKQGNVPTVMRMCIEEVEKRGLNTTKIYSVGSVYDDTEILELRRRLESERSFSFGSTDNIHSVAMLLRLYLSDLPDPLFMLSLRDYRNYRRNRAKYLENDFSLLRSKIGELHPVHRASLGALLRHLLRVASYSDQNLMTVEALAALFRYVVFRGNEVLEDGIHVKGLVLEDLIRNANTLFDELPPSPPAPSFHAPPAFTFSSFSSPEFSRFTQPQAVDSPAPHHSASTRFPFSSSSSDPYVERLSPAVAQATTAFNFGSFLSPESPRSTMAQAGCSTTPHLSKSAGFSLFSSPSDPHVEGLSPNVAQTTPTLTYGLSSKPPRSAEAQAMDPTSGHSSTSNLLSFSTSPSGPHVEGLSSNLAQKTPTFAFGSSLRSGHPRSAEAQVVDPTSGHPSTSNVFGHPSMSTGFSFFPPPSGSHVKRYPTPTDPAYEDFHRRQL